MRRAIVSQSDHLLRRLPRAVIYFCLLALIVFGTLRCFGDTDLRDLGSFIASGRASVQGLDPYGTNYPLIFRPSTSIDSVNLNPPVSVLLFQSLANLDTAQLPLIWCLFSLALYGLPLGGLWSLLYFRQIYVFLLALCVLAWLLVERKRYILAGICIGCLIAIKPQFALLAAFLLLSGCWSVFLSAALTSITLTAIPLVTHGPAIYLQWLRVVAPIGASPVPNNSSLPSILARFGMPSLISIVISLVAIAAIAFLLHRRRVPLWEVCAFGILVSLLAGPVTWGGYTVLLLPALLLMRWTWLTKVAIVLLLVPFDIVVLFAGLSPLTSIFIGGVYGWALLALASSMLALVLQGKPIFPVLDHASNHDSSVTPAAQLADPAST